MVQGSKEEVRGSARIVNGGVEKLQCGKCGADLEEGFLYNPRGPWAGAAPTWVPGQPELNVWGGVKTGGRKERKVSAFRCAKCGRLEFYAL
jgi:hypothetical protein